MALEYITKESISHRNALSLSLSLSLSPPLSLPIPRNRVEPGNFQQHVANCTKSVYFNGVSPSHSTNIPPLV